MLDAAEFFILGFDGETPSHELLTFIKKRPLGALILFKRNISSLEQVIELNASIINAQINRPPIICVDQEGGRVARLRGICTDIPPLKELCPLLEKDQRRAFRIGAMMGRELCALGINLNFAPVCDIALEQNAHDIIGDRSFSADPQLVAHLAAEMIRGMQASGVAACAKHFPGHGSTRIDSHMALPRVDTSLAELTNREIIPFKAAISAGVATMMTAHIMLPALDNDYPATMSNPIINKLLRQHLAFEGVVISDDLDMKAVSDHFSLADILEKSLEASVDMFIIGNNWPKAMTAINMLNDMIKTNLALKTKLLAAQKRINTLRERYIGKALAPKKEEAQAIIRSAPHLALLDTFIAS
jgi:beta-N-acetylhexosaminidase